MADLNQLSSPLRDVRHSFETLIEPHRAPLWRYCLRLTGSPYDAEDLLQESLTKAFARLAQYWQPLDPRPYLFRIASNTWIDTLRKVQPQLLETLPEPTEHQDPGEPLAAMEALIHLLPPRQRVILLLIDVFDFTGPEVAAILGLTEGAVRAALHRGRTTLRQQQAEPKAVPAKRTEPPALIGRFMEAFNRRDISAIAGLIDPAASAEIVGVATEQGRETILKYSMADTFAGPEPYVAEWTELFGRRVVCVYFQTADHERALGWVLELQSAGEYVTGLKGYWFTPEFLEAAAAELGVPAWTHGYVVG